MGALRIGCSGWAYKEWAGDFYPPGTKDRDRLAYYAGHFDTTEINASFYRLPSDAMVTGWVDRAPPGFLFAWKVSRFVTHIRRLQDCEDEVRLVFGRMARLGTTQGPAIIQLPPSLRRDDDRLTRFLASPFGGVRLTVEFRHPSWYEPAVPRILADHGAALCISDHKDAPSPWERTTDWIYIRGHGPTGRYRGRYPQATLDAWAARIAAWRDEGRDVYAYFDNTMACEAPKDAAILKGRLAA